MVVGRWTTTGVVVGGDASEETKVDLRRRRRIRRWRRGGFRRDGDGDGDGDGEEEEG